MKSRTAMWAAALALVTAGLSSYQQPTKTQQLPTPPQAATTSPIELFKLAQFAGLEIKDAANAKVAELEDFVLNGNDGTIAYAVVAVGGMAGIGEKQHVLPWRDLQLTPAKKDGKFELTARVKLTEAELKALEVFDTKRLEKEKTVMVRAKDFKGHKLLGENDKGIAMVDDIVIDILGARVNYVVLAAGEFREFGDKRYAIPWTKLMLAREKDGAFKVSTKLGKQSFEKAPVFDGEHWEKMRDVQWALGVYTHFDSKPYWPPVPVKPVG